MEVEENGDQITKRSSCRHYYIQVKLEFEKFPDSAIGAQSFQSIILNAIEQLFGEAGAAIPIDMLKYNQNTREALIRIPKTTLNKVWSSLTLYGNYQDQDCAFRIIKISPFLTSMAANSRLFVH